VNRQDRKGGENQSTKLWFVILLLIRARHKGDLAIRVGDSNAL